jgi:hypothetical protein
VRPSRPASKAFLAALAKSRGSKPGIRGARKGPVPFSVPSALARATEILSAPPAKAHIVRQPAAGRLLHRLALPLHLCKPQNRKAKAAPWEFSATRKALLQLLAIQLGGVPHVPLKGRPIVQCIRFSARAPDAFADSFKTPVDCLCPSRNRMHKGIARRVPGIGLIADDRPDACDVRQRWEYAPVGAGFCVLEIYSGEAKGSEA